LIKGVVNPDLVLKLFNSLISILQRGVAVGAFRPLEPRQTAVNIVGACAFYFVVNENLKYLWAEQQMLSQEMLDEHAREAIEPIVAGVQSQLKK
jgi:TetR/AcrR family transcriptional regulator